MAIVPINDVPQNNLGGKFVCLPSVLSDQNHGYPAIIEKATAQFLWCRELSRGEWDGSLKQWRVSPATPGPEERVAKCARKGITFVCDTAEEAIALHSRAIETRLAIARFRKDALAALDLLAKNGELSVV